MTRSELQMNVSVFNKQQDKKTIERQIIENRQKLKALVKYIDLDRKI